MKKTIVCLLILLLQGSVLLHAQFGDSRLVIADGLTNEMLKQTIEKNISEFLHSCNMAVMEGKNPKLDKNATTKDARDRFLAMWKTSPMNCAVSVIERSCLTRPAGGYQVRNIPVIMLDAPEEEQDQELVFNLTTDGKIDDIFIPVHQYADIISNDNKEDDIDRRIMVLEFVENFRTAYNRKDLPFLEKVFSNDAIIIVGKEIKIKPKTDDVMRSLPQSKFVYQVKTKGDYLTSLKGVFKNNKYINVDFDEIIVLRHDQEQYKDVYGVTLKQDWKSSTHSDVGYLFLMIDFKDELHPEIHVRTWQPEMFDGRKLRRDEVFQLGNFPLNSIR